MRVHVMRNLGAGYPALKENQIAEVADLDGRRLCEAGLALELPPVARLTPEVVTTEAADPPASKPTRGPRGGVTKSIRE